MASAKEPQTLDDWLGLCYRAQHNLMKPGERALGIHGESGLREAIQEDADMAAAAQKERARLEALAQSVGGPLENRCAISAARLATLRRALAP